MFSGYIRVSAVAGREGDSFISPDVQRETIERLARAVGAELGEIVEELDVSGGKPIDARELGRLVRAVEAGESEGIIVWKVSRFTRSLRDGVNAAYRVKDSGGRLIADDYDSAAKGSGMILGALAGRAEDEREERRQGFADARTRAVKRGAFPAETPYGYRRGEAGKLEPEPEPAAVVRALFRMRDDGLPLSEIARRVSEIAPTPRGGRSWTHSTIRQILRNRVYLGEQRHGQDVNPSAHDALVSEALYLRVQTVKPAPKVDPRDRSASTLLGGRGSLLRCACCGRKLRYLKANRPGSRDSYYCYQPSNGGEPCSARACVPVAELDAFVESWFLSWLRGNVRIANAEIAERRAVEATAEAEDAKAELDAYVQHASALGADFAAGYEARKEKFELLKLEAARAENEHRPYADLPSGDLLAAWPTLEMRRKRQLLAAFVDQINVKKGRGRIAKRVQFVRDGVVVPKEVREVLAQNA
jgi:site-specific DNA recombinase